MFNLCGRTVQSRRLDCSVFAVRLFNSKRSGCSTWAEYSMIAELIEAPIKWRTIAILFLYTGYRRGELAGLEWSDIDFKNMKISIKRTSQYVNGMGIITKTTKNKKSFRTTDIDESCAMILKKYRTWWLEERLKMKDIWPEYITIKDVNGHTKQVKNDRLFVQNDGTPIFPDSITKWISKFSDKYGIEHFTPHNLRHTNVSLLFANGVDVRTVADLVGHAQTSTTLNIYAHVMASTKQAAALKLGEAITTLTQEAVSKKQQDDGRISI